jgi:hypothetical protein
MLLIWIQWVWDMLPTQLFSHTLCNLEFFAYAQTQGYSSEAHTVTQAPCLGDVSNPPMRTAHAWK